MIKRYENAIDDFSAAIALNPEFAAAYVNRSFAKKNLNDIKGAMVDYNNAYAITEKHKNDQGSASDSLNLSKLVEFKADFEEGNAQMTKTAELGVSRFLNFSIIYILKDSVRTFKTDYLNKLYTGTKLSPLPDTMLITNNKNFLSNDTAVQLNNLLSNVQVNAANFNTIFTRAIIRSGINDFNGALDDFNALIAQKPNNNLLYFCRANTRCELVTLINSISDINDNVIHIGTYSNKIKKLQSQKKQFQNIYQNNMHPL